MEGDRHFSRFRGVSLVALLLLIPFPARGQPPPIPPPPGDFEAMRQVMMDFFRVPVSTIKELEGSVPVPSLNLPVVLFIAHHSHVSPNLIITWRKAGNSWLQIAGRLKLPATIFFTTLPEGRIGPPYGRAYGYYWKHKRDPQVPIVLSDEEISDLVQLKICSSHFGLPPRQIISLREKGMPFSRIYGQEYRKRKGAERSEIRGERMKAGHPSAAKVPAGGPARGEGRGPGKGRGR